MNALPCPQCGSTNLTLEDDGLTYCANGHQQDTGTQIETELEFGTRPGHVLRKKEVRPKQKATRIYRGKQGYRFFLLAWQYLLWKQCWTLIHVCGVDADLWGVVKGLWALRLTKLRARFEDDVPDSGDEAREMERSDIEAGTETDGEQTKTEMKSMMKASDGPGLLDIVALNFLGLVIMRSPVKLATFFEWLTGETIPYVRAIRYVPKEIKDHLASEYHSVLDTATLLKPLELQFAVYQTAVMFSSTFGVTVPPVNQLLLLQTYVESLALPLQVYDVAKNLNKITKFSFSYPTAHAPRRSLLSYPEAQLMALVVVATKLTFPFDSDTVTRYPYGPNGAGTLRLDWNAWLRAKEAFEGTAKQGRKTKLQSSKQMQTTDHDILKMSEEQLDEYMNWYQQTWVNHDRKEEGIQREILDMFPLETLHELSVEQDEAKFRKQEEQLEKMKDDRLKAVIGSLRTQEALSLEEAADLETEEDMSIKRPGEGYQQFRKVEELGGVAQVFYDEAARTACLSLEILVRAVRATEEKLERWKTEKKREELFGRDDGEERISGAGRANVDTIEDEEMYL